MSTRMSGIPSRPSSAHAALSAAIWPLMSCCVGVVIQPSACREIHRNVWGPPPAPMMSGTCAWTGLG
jgi:hypothetical protein